MSLMYIENNQASVASPAILSSKNLEGAASFLDKVINSINPAEEIKQYLDDFEKLLPAMIDLNINQAKADSRYDLVDALDKVKQDLGLTYKQGKEVSDGKSEGSEWQESIESAQIHKHLSLIHI